MSSNPWVFCARPNASARLRLFVFPYAGGGPSAFRAWPELLPNVDVRVVHLPGRESRLDERPLDDLNAIVQGATAALASFTTEAKGPFAFFGHSMGAAVAFRVARELRARGAAAPEALVVAGSRAPHLPRTGPIRHGLGDAAMVDQLRSMQGTPSSVLDDPEIRALVLPIVRADFRALELAEPVVVEPLDVPIAAYGGSEDTGVPSESLDAWGALTRREFVRRTFAGGHFFLQPRAREVAAALAADLTSFS